MTPQQSNPYRQQLLAMRATLLEQMSAQRGGVLGRAEAAADHFQRREDSSAQVATERELEFAIGEREVDELSSIDAALARIEAGTYGECTDCGVSIPAPRLQASPEVTRCIECQEKVEHHRSA
ncbi:MAG: TraR/DksA family transcriptional regulator [Polaromonas sp.]